MKKIWVRLLATMLTMTLCISAVGCGGTEDTAQNTAETTDQVSTETNTENETTDTSANEGETVPQVQTVSLQDVWMIADGAPTVTAGAAMLVDAESATVLYEKNAEAKMYPASMTKIVTALVVMDYLQPDDLISVGTEINEITLDSSKAGHKVGETLTVKNALRGLLIPSGNDSGNVLAAATARAVENDPNMSFAKCEAIFTDLMNKKAEELGAINSHFSNAHGYHADDHYSCAHDMALFAMEFMKNETLAEIAAEKSFYGDGADGKAPEGAMTQEYAWVSHNLLVTDNIYQYPYAIGIKTGFTNEAGECLTAAAEKDGVELISVLFQGTDPLRWEETAALFEYGYNQYETVSLTQAGATVAEVELIKHNRLQGDSMPLVYQTDVTTLLPTGVSERMTTEVTIHQEYQMADNDGTIKLKAPVSKGDAVATITYVVDGKEIATQTAYAGMDIEKSSIFNQIQYFFKTLFSNIFTVKGAMVIVGIIVVVALVVFIINKIRNGGGRGRRGGYGYRSSRRGRRRW